MEYKHKEGGRKEGRSKTKKNSRLLIDIHIPGAPEGEYSQQYTGPTRGQIIAEQNLYEMLPASSTPTLWLGLRRA